MRKSIPALVLAAGTLAVAAWAASGHLTVSVEEAKIRRKKLVYAPAIATLHYGDKVESGAKENGWYAVTYKGQEGYLHESAVATKALSAKSGQWSGSSEASSEEATLAGKGFNESVEKEYKKSHSDLDFSKVDKMERRKLSEGDLVSFMKAGGTLPQEAR